MELSFLNFIGALGFGSAAIIVGLATFRSIVEMLHMYGWLSKSLNQSFIKKEEHLVDLTIERLGLKKVVPEIKELMAYRDIDVSEHANNYIQPTRELIRKCLKKGTFTIGHDNRMESQYYVLLREVLVEQQTAMIVAHRLVSFIRDEIAIRRKNGLDAPIEIDMVVGHRDGSPLLAAAVSALLRCCCVFYGEHRYVSDELNCENYVLEGKNVPEYGSAILVDDSTTDGHMLISMTNALRRSGKNVNHAFIVFNRIEGGAKKTLEDMGVTLHSVLPLGRSDLEQLYENEH